MSRLLNRALHWLERIPPGPVIAVVAVVGLYLMSGTKTAADLVPSLEGLNVHQAQALAKSRGYATRVVLRPGGGVKGTVVAQDPAARHIARRGAVITLDVTKGVPQVRVPDVRGMTVEQARAEVVRNYLTVGDVVYRSDRNARPNRVFATDPPTGKIVDVGSTVSIFAGT